MGNWTIEIKGVGSHHNGLDDAGHPNCMSDAERMAKEFVLALQENSHSLESATFTQTGAVDDLLKDD